MVHHNEHPHKEQVELVGTLCFPNLKFDTQVVNFGAILLETHKKVVVKMTNDSLMSLVYEWSFLEDSLTNREDEVPINHVFDILPLSGRLEPGEWEEVEFMFQAITANKLKTIAICQVDGGPSYQV